MLSTLRRGSLGSWSLAALLCGLVLGLLGRLAGSDAVAALAAGVAPLGQLWLNALQLVVLPLVVTQVLTAVAGRDGSDDGVGALGGRTLGLILLYLSLGAVFTLLAGPAALALYDVSPEVASSIRASTVVPASALEAAASRAPGAGDWLSALLPTNLFEAVARGDILGVLLFTAAFGLAVRGIPAPERDALRRVIAGAAQAVLRMTRWILIATPLGVFALVLQMAVGAGMGAVGVLAAWVVFVSALLLVFTLFLYPWTAIVGRTPLRTFARAAAPAQTVALATQSSLACLPALVEGGRKHLGLPPAIIGFVLPLCVSIFKQNRTISSTAKLLFLAHVFGVVLTPGDVVAFLGVVYLLSFGTAGVPRGGVAFTTLPAYLAAGLPIEGVIILEAVETIPDYFKTVLNTTADLSVAAVAAAAMPASAPVAEPLPAPAASAGGAILTGVTAHTNRNPDGAMP